MKVVIYCRVSTKDQNINVQRDKLKEFIKAKNHELVEEYLDEAKSGVTSERPALIRLMEDAKAKKFEAVAVYKLDRFGRSAGDLYKNVEDLKNNGIDFISISDNIDTSTHYGKLLFGILAAFAEFERNIILERTRAGLERARKVGTKSGKPMHRPKKVINMEQLRAYYEYNKLSISACARMFGVHRITIRKRLQELNLL